ncbi:MAG: carboxypeptidase M32 [Candidatus Kapaibacterium sp.]
MAQHRDELYQQALSVMNVVKDLQAASSLLGWDQETYMPEGAGHGRAEQIATLDTLAHVELTKERTRDIVERLRDVDGDDVNSRVVRLFIKEFDKAAKLPEELVRETSRACALAQESWKRAKKERRYELFNSDLAHLVSLKSQAAECYGYKENRYDALLDLFEPGITVSQLRPIFTRLREGTSRVLQAVATSDVVVPSSLLTMKYDKDRQIDFARFISTSIGFDLKTGRVDLSVHPFCTSFGQTDVRLTTRVFEDDIRSCLFGLIHETGHGMYEQGINPALARTFASDGSSMGIHESQSLFWENIIARSEEFWQWALPLMKDHFPHQLSGVSAFDFYKAVNTIEPSLIRIESDEVTYNIHIIIRFEIEEALINGRMNVDDVPSVWNAKMKEYLGIEPAHDAEGCLQDIHWSFGGFGYFPSYTLGKLYAAMLRKALLRDIPEVTDSVRRGDFATILQWLRDNIHVHGKTYTPGELITRVAGEPLSERDFLEYVRAKTQRVYEVSFAE